jgi:nucleotide-binding universal stress UspA family protein
MSRWKWNKIVVGVDGSKESMQALTWACEEAQVAQVPIVAVSVWTPQSPPVSPSFRGFAWGDVVEQGDATQSMLRHCVEQTEPNFPTVDIGQYVIAGNAAEELIRLSESADLVVVGARGHGGFIGMLVGSVSQHVLAHSTCTVVVVR